MASFRISIRGRVDHSVDVIANFLTKFEMESSKKSDPQDPRASRTPKKPEYQKTLHPQFTERDPLVFDPSQFLMEVSFFSLKGIHPFLPSPKEPSTKSLDLVT